MTSSRTDASSRVDVTMPQMGVSVAEGTVVGWRVQAGDRIEAEATICEISTDKIDTEVPSPVTGILAEVLVPVETTVPVGTVLARIAVGEGVARMAAGEKPAERATGDSGTRIPVDERAAGHADSGNGAARRYSPVVQRIAAEHRIDLGKVTGTGRGGRVRKQDVLALIERAPAAEPPLHVETPYQPAESPRHMESPNRAGPAGAPGGGLSRMRRQIGEHMKRSLETAAHCTTWIEVDMGRVEAVRARQGVTALAFVASAATHALREHLSLNAWLEGDRYTRHHDVNLGIAVSLGEEGLIVPVIHGAHEFSVEGIASRIKDLARRARARELKPDEVRGGTFTITNPGVYGSIMATPIINQPQVAILDFEAIIKRPVVTTDARGEDSISIRPITILGLSWDHRALDGAQAAQFLASVKRHLEKLPGS